MDCKLWIFDMDGTLTDSMEAVWRRAPEVLLESFGRVPRPDMHDTMLAMDVRDSAAFLIKEYSLPLDRAAYWRMIGEIVPRLYRTVELKSGAREMLLRLKAQGARLCICSNTWEAQCREVLGRLGVAELFDFYITAQGAKSKQHPEVFFEALHRLGGTEPAECTVCEDTLYAASVAAKAGFNVIAIADKCSRADEPALRRLSSQFLYSWDELDWGKI